MAEEAGEGPTSGVGRPGPGGNRERRSDGNTDLSPAAVSLRLRGQPNGTVLLLRVGWKTEHGTPGGALVRGLMQSLTPYYTLLKQGGVWYMAGPGRVPTGASEAGIRRWLQRANRELISAQIIYQPEKRKT